MSDVELKAFIQTEAKTIYVSLADVQYVNLHTVFLSMYPGSMIWDSLFSNYSIADVILL